MNTRWQILGFAALLLIAGVLIWVFAASPSPQEPSPQTTAATGTSPPPAPPAEAPPGSGKLDRAFDLGTPASLVSAQQQEPSPAGPDSPRKQAPSAQPVPMQPKPAPAPKPAPSDKDPLAIYPAEDAPEDQEQTYEDIWARPIPVPPEAKGLKRLTKQNGVWVDPKRRRVIIAGRVVLRRGPLEMFACPRQTKEHESVVGVNTKVYVVHAALLALGVEPGRPVQFDPEYRPAQGPEIRVLVCWTDPQGKRRCVPAQKWVRNVKTNKEMQHPWLFTGSQWWESPDGKQRYYMAEQGDFICVSNFPTAMLDLPIRSSNAASQLLFTAFTRRIPPLGTDVALILEPVKPPKAATPSPDSKKPKPQPGPAQKNTPPEKAPPSQPGTPSRVSPEKK